MPTFCRHNRLVERCPICSKRERASTAQRSAARRPSRAASGAPSRAPRKSASSGMVVRHLARAPEDGYEHDLLPGLRSSVDAARLARDLAWAEARLAALRDEHPAAREQDPEEALWLVFLSAYLSPTEDDDPFAGILGARTPWATGELPRLEGVPRGPRAAAAPGAADAGVAAYRAWAGRSGGQLAALTGEAGWRPTRRFDRAFERLASRAFDRAARFEYLALAAGLGLAELELWTLHLSAASPTDPVGLAAKRLLGIGDPVLLQRRGSDLAHGTGVPLAALDLAFFNFSRPGTAPRYTAGSAAAPSDDRCAAIAAALGVPAGDGDDHAPDEPPAAA